MATQHNSTQGSTSPSRFKRRLFGAILTLPILVSGVAAQPAMAQEITGIEDYRSLLAEGLIRPSALEIYIADADGSNQRQLTDNGAANFAPYWHPSGERIIFSSNMDGTGLERVTYSEDFDGFPVFSPDGRYLVFGSNRNKSHEGNTNLFLAEWLN